MLSINRRINSTPIVLLAAIIAATAQPLIAARALSPQDEKSEKSIAVVLKANASVKAKPSAEAEVTYAATRGAEFSVTGSTEGWVKVALKTKREGESETEGWLPEAEVGLKVDHHGKVCVEVSLEKAFELGALNGEFRGTGASSGDSILLKAKNELTAEICPKFEPGTILENGNAAAQNMVLSRLMGKPSGMYIRPEVELHFEPGIEADYIFEAYCVNFSKDNPGNSDTLRVQGPANSDIAKLIALHSNNVTATQLAIWAVTDNVKAHDVTEKFGATSADIAAARNLMEEAGLSLDSFRLFR